jgi:hypothetical protein
MRVRESTRNRPSSQAGNHYVGVYQRRVTFSAFDSSGPAHIFSWVFTSSNTEYVKVVLTCTCCCQHSGRFAVSERTGRVFELADVVKIGTLAMFIYWNQLLDNYVLFQ